MSGEDNYMDESFRKMSEGIQATYHSGFWNDALNQLENDSLDEAFRLAAAQVSLMPGFESGGQGLADTFMDEAFRDAAGNITMVYDPLYWSEMADVEPDLQMDESFAGAAASVVANYSPSYWGEANSALEQEGLHYEYQQAYWDEARGLLDKADRKLFFAKWTSVAIGLLLISFLGLNSNYSFNLSKVDLIELKANQRFAQLPAINSIVKTIKDDFFENERTLTSVTNPSPKKRSTYPPQISSLGQNIYTLEGLLEGDSEQRLPNEFLTEQFGDESLNTINTDHTGTLNEINVATHLETRNGEDKDPLCIRFDDSEIALVNEIRLLPVNKGDYQLGSGPKIELKALELKPLHQLSLVGLVGLGQNYGANTYLLTKRYGAHLHYVYAGSKGYRAAKPGHVEWGVTIGFNYVECDGLGIENQVTRYKENGEVEKYWRNLQVFDLFYGNASVFMNYSLNNHHKFSIGLGVDRLFAVQSNMAYRMDDDKGIQTVNNNWGVQDGLSLQDIKASLGYEYMFNRNWAFQLNFTTGIVNRTNNEFFNFPNGRNLERNLTLGIRRTLFTKL